MSQSEAEARFLDGLVLYGTYNDTVDLVRTALYRTRDEWADDDVPGGEHRRCRCGSDEPVMLWARYPGDAGKTWPGRACRACLCVTAGRDPYE